MNSDLVITLAVLGYGALASFTFYWHGYNKGRKEMREETELYLDDLDAATRLIGELATKQRHPAGRLAVVREES